MLVKGGVSDVLVNSRIQVSLRVEGVKGETFHVKPIAELLSVTCHMGSHSVTCHTTQVNAPRLNPSQAGRYTIYLPRTDGRLSWFTGP